VPQAPPLAATTTQVWVPLVHATPGPHVVIPAQDEPNVGCAAHVPHASPGATAQKPD
jgi:hypothetical protein